MYLKSKTERSFGIACLGKKLVFDTEFCDYFEHLISKIEKFYRVKELFKVNKNDFPDCQYYLGCNAKRMVRLTVLEKSSYLNRKSRLFRLFYFQKYRNFVGPRSCSKRTDLGIEYPLGM